MEGLRSAPNRVPPKEIDAAWVQQTVPLAGCAPAVAMRALRVCSPVIRPPLWVSATPSSFRASAGIAPRVRTSATTVASSLPVKLLQMLREEQLRSSPALLVHQVDSLRSPKLEQVLAIEEEAFPPCERLGGTLMQYYATLRTSGVLLAEVGSSVAGYLLYSRTADSGLIAKIAVGDAFQRQGVGSALLKQASVGLAAVCGPWSA